MDSDLIYIGEPEGHDYLGGGAELEAKPFVTSRSIIGRREVGADRGRGRRAFGSKTWVSS